jgi:hypothetical protein
MGVVITEVHLSHEASCWQMCFIFYHVHCVLLVVALYCLPEGILMKLVLTSYNN